MFNYKYIFLFKMEIDRWFVFMIILILIIIIFPINKKCQEMQDNFIRILTRQSARWITAARQDKNMMIKVLHANYGLGYFWAIKDIANGEDFKRATGLDLLKFENEIVQTQDEVTIEMSRLCKNWGPKKSYITKIAGEGD